jgi:hypothetical protein
VLLAIVMAALILPQRAGASMPPERLGPNGLAGCLNRGRANDTRDRSIHSIPDDQRAGREIRTARYAAVRPADLQLFGGVRLRYEDAIGTFHASIKLVVVTLMVAELLVRTVHPHLESEVSATRRTPRLRPVMSRYLRSDRGHPSPRPDRRWTIPGSGVLADSRSTTSWTRYRPSAGPVARPGRTPSSARVFHGVSKKFP